MAFCLPRGGSIGRAGSPGGAGGASGGWLSIAPGRRCATASQVLPPLSCRRPDGDETADRRCPVLRPDCHQCIQPLFPFSFPRPINTGRQRVSQSTEKLIAQCCKQGGSREDVFTNIKERGSRDEGHERTVRIPLTLNNPLVGSHFPEGQEDPARKCLITWACGTVQHF